MCHAQWSAEQTFSFHPQYSLPGQRGCQHVSGSVRLGGRLLPHGHPLLGHGRRGSGCHWSRRSYHGHFRWVTEESSSNTDWSQRPWVTLRSELVVEKLQSCWWKILDWAKRGGGAACLSAYKDTISAYELFIVANSSHKHLRSTKMGNRAAVGGEAFDLKCGQRRHWVEPGLN